MNNSEFLTIKNDFLIVSITKIGAELCSIKKVDGNTEYMWDANKDIWGSYAPVLFPIIGGLKNNQYTFERKEYSVTKHGFIRNNKNIVVKEHSENSITFLYKYNEETLKNYPFEFEFQITYSLNISTISIDHKVINHGDNDMYFSLGGHPAFKCPLHNNENYEDYQLQFGHKETSNTHLLSSNGLLSGETKPLLINSDILLLKHSLFNDDALIFKDLKSRKVSLVHKTKGNVLSVEFKDFNYLGIWAKPNGDFVCIEPWLGVTDNENTNGDFKTKEGIQILHSKKDFFASYRLKIN